MSSSEVEDSDLYHYDFTTASDWEVFIAKIEEIIHQWKLQSNKQLSNDGHFNLFEAKWETTVETLSFADVDFTLTRYLAKPKESSEDGESLNGSANSNLPKTLEEIMSLENDYIPVIPTDDGTEFQPHILVHWYGLSHFMVLNPASGSISSESQIKMLLSSCCMALNNTNCEVPIFIRALEPHQHFYLGIWESEGTRTEFEMIHLHKVPSHCRYLTGLLNFFKSKIGNGVPVAPVTVAARFSYHLQDWTAFTWSQELPSFEDLLPDKLSTLPFGATTEPISSLTLYALWPDLLETVVVDSENYTDFEPTQAVSWLISVHKTDNLLCILSDYLAEFILLCISNRTSEEVLGDFLAAKETGDISQTLSALTEPKLTSLSDILGHVSLRKGSRQEGPLPTNLILPILYYLFPDATENSKHNYPNEEADRVAHQGMKTCMEDSLVWRLALVMAHAMHGLGGVKAIAHIWHEFASEVRFRWTTSTLIPGVASGFPDAKTCLLHQKLQMINCCIERKKEREKKSSNGNESESEEEFFDCNDDDENAEREEGKQVPSGRLSQHGTLKLVSNGQPMYIPITQGDSPKTEDQAEEDTQVLLKLGSDAEGSQLRARIMSPSLRSDMESFKAANPGAIFADFIRWQSPRDWVEEDELDDYGQKKGHLSARMLLPGNIWMDVWDSARSVPARLQKRLFDETTEAEKALHFIESQEPGRAAQSVLPVLFQAGLSTLSKEVTENLGQTLPSVNASVERLVKRAEGLSRLPIMDVRKYQELCFEMGRIEALLAQIISLRFKFCSEEVDDDTKTWLGQTVMNPQVLVPGGPSGPIGTKIKTLLLEAIKAASPTNELEPTGNDGLGASSSGRSTFPLPEKREFILRCHAPRYSPHSKPVPHRMMAAITKSDIAVAAAFSQDSTFF